MQFVDGLTVTLKDLVTGDTATVSGRSSDWWKTGDGACDCQRQFFFKNRTETHVSDHCIGQIRFLVIAVSWGNLKDFNHGYEN